MMMHGLTNLEVTQSFEVHYLVRKIRRRFLYCSRWIQFTFSNNTTSWRDAVPSYSVPVYPISAAELWSL